MGGFLDSEPLDEAPEDSGGRTPIMAADRKALEKARSRATIPDCDVLIVDSEDSDCFGVHFVDCNSEYALCLVSDDRVAGYDDLLEIHCRESIDCALLNVAADRGVLVASPERCGLFGGDHGNGELNGLVFVGAPDLAPRVCLVRLSDDDCYNTALSSEYADLCSGASIDDVRSMILECLDEVDADCDDCDESDVDSPNHPRSRARIINAIVDDSVSITSKKLRCYESLAAALQAVTDRRKR